MRTGMEGKRKVIHTLLPSYGHVQDGLSLGRLKLPASLPFSKCQVKALLQVAYMEGVPIELISYSYIRDCDQMITFCDEIFCR